MQSKCMYTTNKTSSLKICADFLKQTHKNKALYLMTYKCFVYAALSSSRAVAISLKTAYKFAAVSFLGSLAS